MNIYLKISYQLNNENPIGTKDIQVDIISIETFYSKRVFLSLHFQDINKLGKSTMVFLKHSTN